MKSFSRILSKIAVLMLAILIAVNTVWPAASTGLYSYANDKASSQAESADSCKTSDGVGSGGK